MTNGPIKQSAACSPENYHIVQRLIAPDPNINGEQDLFFHRVGLAGYDQKAGNFYALCGAKIRFDSFFNAFPANAFGLQSSNRLEVHIQAKGKCILELILVRHDKSWDQLFHAIVDCHGNT